MRARGAVLLLGVVLSLVSGCAGSVTSQQVPVTRPQPATLKANLYKPSGAGPFPALVLLHGCSGIQPVTIAWAQWLTAQGYVALVLDSFSGRGLTRVCGDSAPLTGGARAPDVHAAAQHLKSLPFVDGERLGAIGVYRSSIPLLVLLGADDNWTPAEPCRLLAEAARRDGRNVTAVVYPKAHHGFDSASARVPVIIADARRGAGATVAYNPKAHEDAERRVKQFLHAQFGK